MSKKILWVGMTRPTQAEIDLFDQRMEQECEITFIKVLYKDISGSFSADIRLRSMGWDGYTDVIIKDLPKQARNHDIVVSTVDISLDDIHKIQQESEYGTVVLVRTSTTMFEQVNVSVNKSNW